MKDPNQKIEIDKKTGRVRVYTVNTEKSATQQQFADECDVNNIMRRYEKTGEIVHRNAKAGVYADFSEITNYQDMMEKVIYAQEAFSTLPAKIRTKFRNDPGELLEFLQDKKNLKEAEELGLLEIIQKPAVVTNAKPQNANDPAVKTDTSTSPPST